MPKPTPHSTINLPRAVGDNLVLRWAEPKDIDGLIEFNQDTHTDVGQSPDLIGLWTKDLLSGKHPTVTLKDFVVVQDTAAQKIVSTMCLIPQVWCYDDIPFGVGRPELVGSDPDYRRRGLVRASFEAIHQLSAAYGHMVQGITGIGWFYRQFDYEYALPMGGYEILSLSAIPTLKAGESEPYTLRPATPQDIPLIVSLYETYAHHNKLVTTIIDAAYWHYSLFEMANGSIYKQCCFCFEDDNQEVVGIYLTPSDLWWNALALFAFMTVPHISPRQLLPTLLRSLKKQGEIYANREDKKLTSIYLALGAEHPIYEMLADKLGPSRPPYAWYIRVPDLPAFLHHIAPVLERRLAQSVMQGYSGPLNLNFYQDGLQLTFDKGQLSHIKPWQAPSPQEPWQGASFPPLIFLKLLFGYRSFDELREAFPDCQASTEGDNATLLVKILFPKKLSWIVPLS